MGKPYILIQEDEIFEIKIQGRKLYLESQRNVFFVDDINSVWYRRGGIYFLRKLYDHPSINIHMNEAEHWLEDYVMHILEAKKHINKQRNSHVNKLLVLEKARKTGLDVPAFYLAENTDDVKLGKTITKSITGNVMLELLDSESDGMMYTSVIDKKNIEDFFISFFQEKIEKDFEIRSFYLNGRIWSMAIFSQNDEQTRTDFRKYNMENPNRNIRYQLPDHVEEKVIRLMQALDLNCGSLDFIKSGSNYYFLEVNPVGQFGNISFDCNYMLEKEIAEYL
ncbi:ATP-GRASP peptide maturase of grasp-with-spasm system [Chryseobacterium sp. SORGH_AS909]|uniref:ATP-GRASP peptide maturase of grasp-with-spasm system n=1 Tax=Chryseobacterium camelliae TaxID=1265445 RepID=A0ABU0THD2_9FLAO|nr:ATP-GRASP peptide maturase of grasp-with-spasm system [Chryseobacterium camelliae]MDQ1100398.1 ATP-GRASP peptide maturase of grasp-with-spasm system [Chryseobacterium sp. SORGH_AS_1048]MDR6087739.1 ATP-GRASP peptide maturase of grasp-with-spasm system [Chryseobacterium sp. SORGH_AS_0909]MDR6132115.1 ATP-GRASP peptide maturase of grasp-with-spasm system [Chryseobacterium sp. SORGH_AS_1175]MDT3405734.1 ATP-GRASP peptide maturase of grasp-with-spasm system [Pseudacidovorax intermedius]